MVARISLDMLRSRAARREKPDDFHMPDPVVTDPEHEAVLADAVGLAMLVVLDTLSDPRGARVRPNVSRSFCTRCSRCRSTPS